MRLFLIWHGQCDRLGPLISALQSKGHKIVYWTGVGEDCKNKIPGAIFHEYYQAYDGVSAPGFEIDQFPPPSRESIKRYSQLEQRILVMMNKHFDHLCLDERKHFYYNLLQYWQGIFGKYKPEMVIFSTIPHSVYDYVIYQLAGERGIKTIMFEDNWVSDRLLMYNDWQEGSKTLQQALRKNRGKNFSLQNLSPDIQEYYNHQTNPQFDTTPIYMKVWKERYSPKNVFFNRLKILVKSVVDGTVFKRLYPHLSGFNLKREYRSLERKPNFEKSFVYAPLGFQPERTTTVMGDVFSDQILMVKTLSYCLPKGWLLFVKEHPSQWWLRGIKYSSVRYHGYYQRLAQIKHVRLVPVHTDTYQLINHSKAVATVSGIAGWEAILRSKPALVFGYPWYRDCPCLFRVKDVESCRSAFQKIIAGHCPKQQDVINYLKSFDRATFHGYVEGLVGKNSQLTSEQNISNITKVILTEIENLTGVRPL